MYHGRLLYDVASGSNIMPCFKTDIALALVYYIFTGSNVIYDTLNSVVYILCRPLILRT